VLATGILLVVLGHLTAGSLTTVCAALVGLYGASQHFRPGHGYRPPDHRSRPADEQDRNGQP